MPGMNILNKVLGLALLFNLYFFSNSFAFGQEIYVTLKPVLNAVASTSVYGTISFKVTNVYSKDVMIESFIKLMTNDNSRSVSIEEFRRGAPPPSWGPKPRLVVLKPGQTDVIDSNYSVETLSFLKAKNKNLFGEISGYVIDPNKSFRSDSDPFSVPEKLAEPPWIDLGIQNYFSVSPNVEKIAFKNGITDNGLISIPVDVKNISNNSYIINNRLVLFFLKKNGLEDKNQLLSDTIKEAGLIFNPGDLVELSDRSYTTIGYLNASGYKPGDKIIAIVAGQIPDTNQVFECISAPFVLPSFPNK